MNTLLVHLALVVTMQSPDGQGPAVGSQPAPQEAPPPVSSAEEEERRRQAAQQNPEAPAPTALQAAPQASSQPAPSEAAPTPLVSDKKEARDHFSGIFVAAAGGVVMLLGLGLGSFAAVLNLAPTLPFPGGATERTGFAMSAIVGAVFCGLIGAALVAVGAALVGVSFL